jgi:hypothetical protein
MYAFDRVHHDGGHLTFGHSTHWKVQHVAHYDNLAHQLTHFIPPADLDTNWRALIGFDGSVVVGDKDYREPMPVHMMFLGVAYLQLALMAWFIKRSWDKFWRTSP